VIRAHKIALAPNDRQAGLLMQHCGWARVASNWAIDTFAAAWFTGEGEDNEWLTDRDLRPLFNAVKRDLFPWSRSLSQAAAKNAIINTCKGLKAWGVYCQARKAGQPARRVGFPKYRKRGRHMSYTASNGRNTIRPDGKRVRLPGVGWVNMREALRFAGDITSVTVSLSGGRWHAAFTVDTGEPEPIKRAGETVGIDMGLTVLTTLSDETRIRNPKVLAAALAELCSLDKAIARSRNTHGKNRPSKRRARLYELRNRQHARVRHLRRDHHHKATCAIAKTWAVVKVETLNVSGMVRNKRLARSISDAGMAEFVRMLEYKCAWHGAQLVKVDPWFPSSRTCSACGAVKAALSLSERTYRCDRCGFECDRDLNAARNIQAYPVAGLAAVNSARRPGRTAGDGRTGR
jgi:putative transposase